MTNIVQFKAKPKQPTPSKHTFARPTVEDAARGALLCFIDGDTETGELLIRLVTEAIRAKSPIIEVPPDFRERSQELMIASTEGGSANYDRYLDYLYGYFHR